MTRRGVSWMAVTMAVFSLATVPATAAGQGAVVPSTAGPHDPHADWSRVERLHTGTRVKVTRDGSAPAEWRMLTADADGVTLLNLAFVNDIHARSAVLAMAKKSPAALATIRTPGHSIVEEDVRVSSEGVFLAGRRIAPAEWIVTTASRPDVVEVRKLDKPINGVRGTLLGFLGGFIVADIVASHMDEVCYGCGSLALIGGLIGGMAGHFVDHRLVYRRP